MRVTGPEWTQLRAVHHIQLDGHTIIKGIYTLVRGVVAGSGKDGIGYHLVRIKLLLTLN